MNSDIKIGVIGGDERQLVIAQTLSDAGFEVAVFGFKDPGAFHKGITRSTDLRGAVHDSAAIVLPLPYSRDGKNIFCPLGSERDQAVGTVELFENLNPDQLVIGGNFDENIICEAKARGIKLCDYYTREDIGILNAIPSAEGALEVAFRELPVTVYGSSVHILGFGKIGKVLSKILYSLGADITVYARAESDLAWIKVYGYRSYDITQLDRLSAPFEGATVIFNTVPKQLLDESILKKMSPDTLIIDLTSAPGGVDAEAAEKLGIKTVRALSLPGKTAPISAGKIISEGIFGILQGEGIIP